MKRVGFIGVPLNANWIGGVNYFRSLFNALALSGEGSFQPVILASAAERAKAKALYGEIEIIANDFLRPLSPGHLLRKGVQRVIGRDLLLEIFLKRKGITILSHSPTMGPRSRFPNLSWIADFQHIHLPQFFEPGDRMRRDKRMHKVAREATGLIVSSRSASNDFLARYPGEAGKVNVLPFTPRMEAFEAVPLSTLRELYKIGSKYIFLPNQFWAHKNHLLVVNALASLKTEGGAVQIVCTGSTQDTRNPSHYDALTARVRELGVGSAFKVLGVVPYLHMQSLMHHAHAVINPSRFEGWSTTVEEAKLLGKKLLLSNIPVHREQAENEAAFFSPDEPSECAAVLQRAWNDIPRESSFSAENAQRHAVDFGDNYVRILNRYL